VELGAQSEIKLISPIGESVTFQNSQNALEFNRLNTASCMLLSNFFGRDDVDMGPRVLLPG